MNDPHDLTYLARRVAEEHDAVLASVSAAAREIHAELEAAYAFRLQVLNELNRPMQVPLVPTT